MPGTRPSDTMACATASKRATSKPGATGAPGADSAGGGTGAASAGADPVTTVGSGIAEWAGGGVCAVDPRANGNSSASAASLGVRQRCGLSFIGQDPCVCCALVPIITAVRDFA